MKFLHTSDWHVGKTLKGRSRLDEQEAVLTEIVGFAGQHQVDAVLIAGDLYDAAAPSADAQRILIKTLLALAGTTFIDAKRRRSFGEQWSRFTQTTSNVPFAAIATGRNELGPALREIGILRPLIATAAYVMVFVLHGWLFGAPLV